MRKLNLSLQGLEYILVVGLPVFLLAPPFVNAQNVSSVVVVTQTICPLTEVMRVVKALQQ